MESFCKNCGAAISSDDKFCESCGAKNPDYNGGNEVSSNTATVNTVESTNNQYTAQNFNNNTQTTGKKTSGLAIGSLVCSLVGLLVAGMALGIVAICLSIAAKNRMKTYPNEGGKGMATAGLVIGIIDVAFALLWTVIRVSSLSSIF